MARLRLPVPVLGERSLDKQRRKVLRATEMQDGQSVKFLLSKSQREQENLPSSHDFPPFFSRGG